MPLALPLLFFIALCEVFASTGSDYTLNPDDDTTHTPVVIVHGILAHTIEYFFLEVKVRNFLRDHGVEDVYVRRVQVGSDLSFSLSPLQHQVDALAASIQADPKLQGGLNLMCHSQGSLVCRGYVEMYNSPRVKRLILLAGVTSGVYIDLGWPLRLFTPFYTRWAQEHLSVANFWRDPYHDDLYREHSMFLPYLNNELGYNETYRQNMLLLEALVLVGSPDDGIVKPWQTSVDGFYKPGTLEVQDLTERDLYVRDLCGHRTLDETGRLFRIVMPGMFHASFLIGSDLDRLDDEVLPFLFDGFPPR